MTTFVEDGDTDFQLNIILNQGLELSDNFKGALLETSLVAGVNTVLHGLGFIPIGYIVLYTEDETTIFGTDVTLWTIEQIFLNSSAPSPRVRLFVL